jgi:hypothetical protein
MNAKPLLVSASLLLSAACHYRPMPVPVAGDRSSIAALAGTWTGTYRGTESGRTGNIAFAIRVSGDSAFGDVQMDAPNGQSIVQLADDPTVHQRHARGPTFLAVRFLDVVGGDVEGALEPYVAPDCQCTVRTAFMGRVVGDTIRGSFVTRGTMTAPQTGVWAVARRNGPPVPVNK